jgi:hypothetical protein
MKKKPKRKDRRAIVIVVMLHAWDFYESLKEPGQRRWDQAGLRADEAARLTFAYFKDNLFRNKDWVVSEKTISTYLEHHQHKFENPWQAAFEIWFQYKVLLIFDGLKKEISQRNLTRDDLARGLKEFCRMRGIKTSSN